MFEDASANSLDLEDLILCAVVLAIPPGGYWFAQLAGGKHIFPVAVLASGLVCLKLLAGGQVLGSPTRAWVGGLTWLGGWSWLAFGHSIATANVCRVIDFLWLGWLSALLFTFGRSYRQWRRDDRILAGMGLGFLLVTMLAQPGWRGFRATLLAALLLVCWVVGRATDLQRS